MLPKRILVVDDDPDIRDVLKITLEGDGYHIVEAQDGVQALERIERDSPHLVILDVVMPGMDGHQVCQRLKENLLLRHLPVIMLTGKGELQDKVKGMDRGADDYLVKPFEPEELLARVRMILRRSEIDLDANPLTYLPGNVSIARTIEEAIARGVAFAVGYLDLDQFKIFNDRYGFTRGDQVILGTARVLLETITREGNPGDFLGHQGGDDFVYVTTPDRVERICQQVIEEFDRVAPTFYDQQDLEKGYIEGVDRRGKIIKVPLISVTIAVVTNLTRPFKRVAEVAQVGAELKLYGKRFPGSHYFKDRRFDGKLSKKAQSRPHVA